MPATIFLQVYPLSSRSIFLADLNSDGNVTPYLATSLRVDDFSLYPIKVGYGVNILCSLPCLKEGADHAQFLDNG